ncbi:MAG TPA: CRISPR-associated endonuclease Cas3'', partial [Paludibacteraceae bacterium]|nr:CRISPR-associated endonuclease Cas3'' [Paludibacteraceae bacterium]
MEYNAGYFSNFILNSDRYYAHLPKEGDARSPESLAEHSALVYEYAKSIAEKQQLYPIISGLIQKSIPAKLSNSQLLAKEIEHLFWQAIAFHDLGKINSEFQRKRMNNHTDLFEVQHKFEAKHSVIGMYIYLAHFWSAFLKLQLTDEESVFLCNIALYLSYPIYQHHSPAIYQTQDLDHWECEDLFDLKPYLALFK